MATRTLVLCLSAFCVLPAIATTYHMSHNFAGETFFDDWIFYGHYDNLTNGNADFLNREDAGDKKLAYINERGNAIMRVDNTTELKFGDVRETIHIHTKDRYSVGSVWIADMLHVPYGCSVWPAFWSVAQNWPIGGEIDTFEGVNMVPRNQMAMHTTAGCTQQNPVQSSTIINSTNCDYQANFNEGCVVTDPSYSSYGAEFAKNGGGIFVTEFAESGISVWFFNRSSIPSSLQGNASSFEIASLGIPTANWPTGGCSVDRYFAPQHLVFDITLCGDLAGLPTIFMQTCKGDCYHDYVLGPPSNYDNAYFEVASVRVFNNGRDTTLIGNSGERSVAHAWSAVSGIVALLGYVVLQAFLTL